MTALAIAAAVMAIIATGMILTAMVLFREPIQDPIEREYGDER